MKPVRPEDAKRSEGKKSNVHQHAHLRFESLANLLDKCRQQQTTITYIEVADALDVPAPQRIHKVTLLLEALTEHDHKLNLPPRTALVVSKNRSGLPAKGFFLQAQELGLMHTSNDQEFHKQCLRLLFND